MPPSPLARLRKLCLAFPDAHEVEAWGEPTFRVRNKLFAMYAGPDNHHGRGRHAVWCKAAPGNQDIMVNARPDRFFVPPYVGPSGWVGIWLDQGTDWPELKGLLEDSYLMTAPKPRRTAADKEKAATPKKAAARKFVNKPAKKKVSAKRSPSPKARGSRRGGTAKPARR